MFLSAESTSFQADFIRRKSFELPLYHVSVIIKYSTLKYLLKLENTLVLVAQPPATESYLRCFTADKSFFSLPKTEVDEYVFFSVTEVAFYHYHNLKVGASNFPSDKMSNINASRKSPWLYGLQWNAVFIALASKTKRFIAYVFCVNRHIYIRLNIKHSSNDQYYLCSVGDGTSLNS